MVVMVDCCLAVAESPLVATVELLFMTLLTISLAVYRLVRVFFRAAAPVLQVVMKLTELSSYPLHSENCALHFSLSIFTILSGSLAICYPL